MSAKSEYLYLIALGSNQRHPLFGPPGKILKQAVEALEMGDIHVFSASQIMTSRPLGPSQREYANAAVIIISPLDPAGLLQRLKSLEAHFGKRPGGQKWRARVLDLDILLWSEGPWIGPSRRLVIPHPEMHRRRFVLQPAGEIAADWRYPDSGRRIKHLLHRINRANRLDP